MSRYPLLVSPPAGKQTGRTFQPPSRRRNKNVIKDEVPDTCCDFMCFFFPLPTVWQGFRAECEAWNHILAAR